jgi:hypothetical protein
MKKIITTGDAGRGRGAGKGVSFGNPALSADELKLYFSYDNARKRSVRALFFKWMIDHFACHDIGPLIMHGLSHFHILEVSQDNPPVIEWQYRDERNRDIRVFMAYSEDKYQVAVHVTNKGKHKGKEMVLDLKADFSRWFVERAQVTLITTFLNAPKRLNPGRWEFFERYVITVLFDKYNLGKEWSRDSAKVMNRSPDGTDCYIQNNHFIMEAPSRKKDSAAYVQFICNLKEMKIEEKFVFDTPEGGGPVEKKAYLSPDVECVIC